MKDNNNVTFVGFDVDGLVRDFLHGIYNAFIDYYPDLKDEFGDIYEQYYILNKFPLKHVAQKENYKIKGRRFDELEDEEDKKKLLKRIKKDIFNGFAQKAFEEAEPYDGAVEAANEVSEYVLSTGNIPCLCSHQDEHLQKYTLRWLGKYDVRIGTIYFPRESNEKFKYVDVMIDDSPKVLNSKQYDTDITIKIKHTFNELTPADYEIDHLSEAKFCLKEILE